MNRKRCDYCEQPATTHTEEGNMVHARPVNPELTTTTTYERDLAAARRQLAFDLATPEEQGWINDALNQTWLEGITIDAWVYATRRRPGAIYGAREEG